MFILKSEDRSTTICYSNDKNKLEKLLKDIKTFYQKHNEIKNSNAVYHEYIDKWLKENPQPKVDKDNKLFTNKNCLRKQIEQEVKKPGTGLIDEKLLVAFKEAAIALRNAHENSKDYYLDEEIARFNAQRACYISTNTYELPKELEYILPFVKKIEEHHCYYNDLFIEEETLSI